MKFSLEKLKSTFSNMKAISTQNGNKYRSAKWLLSRAKREYFDTEAIEKIINSGNLNEIIALSRYFFNYNGLYRRIIIYFSTMLLYDTVVVPKFLKQNIKKERFLKNFYKVLNFIDKLSLPQEIIRIFTIMLVDGAYYGLIYKTPDDSIIFGDLPRAYCRTRFRSNNGNQILEFDVSYFNTYTDEREKELVKNNFPESIRNYYDKWIKGGEGAPQTSWYLCQENEGVAFIASLDGNASSYTLPFFIQTIPAISRLKDYEKADLDSVQNELSKLVINKIPLDKENELAFELPEVEAIHRGVVEMLKDNPHVDVITTFCDTDVASLGSTVDNVRNDLSAVTHLVYNEAGVSKQLFDNDSAISIQYSVQNDLSLVLALIKPIQRWINFIINEKFGKNSEFFYEINILPISHYNRDEMSNLYLKGAQYGYSKFYAGAALGIKQSDLISLTIVENDFLDLDARMIPLQSSHTTANSVTAERANSSGSSNKEEGGRPEQELKNTTEKTVENKESM
jgi:hypothetical protein